MSMVMCCRGLVLSGNEALRDAMESSGDDCDAKLLEEEEKEEG